MNWDDLRVFLAVARKGSLSAAARALRVTQPTVGRRIAAFEQELGTKLFLANRLGQELSPAGSDLLAHAERMEQCAIAAERSTSGRDLRMRGAVSVTAAEWLINAVLAPVVGPLSAQYPELELELLADVRHLNLMRREADIALRPSRFEEDGVVQRKVAHIAFGLYASDAYLSRYGMPDFAKRCEGHRLIAMSKTLTRIPDVEWLPSISDKASVVVRTNGREPMATLASAGLGIACLPRFVGDRMSQLRLLRSPSAAPERALWLGVHRDARTVPRVRTTVVFLIDAFERLGTALAPDSPKRGKSTLP